MVTIVMRFLMFLAMLCFFDRSAFSQNLLANGSFEEENICTEYSKNCAPEGWICNSLTSNYYFDIGEWAYDGRHMVGLIAGNEYHPLGRSFIRTRLLCALRKGHQYKVQFYARSQHPVFDSLGAYFSATDFLFDKRSYRDLIPSLVFRDTSITPGAAWKRISFVYTAGGEENFLTIGNFKRQPYVFVHPPEIKGSYYIYIDSVSCTPLHPNELAAAAADSMRSLLYEENERHNLLEKKTAYYRRNPPALPSKAPTTILRCIDTLLIPDILFASASARLNAKSFSVLDSFCVALAGKNIDSLVVEGHTDSVGNYGYNKKLSAERARAVSLYIGEKIGAAEGEIMIRHYAYSKPIASNATSAGRQRNRRVEIYLYTHE